MYTDKQLDSLRNRIKDLLSDKRFAHTEGVERMAVLIGELCLPDRVDELRACALLHDAGKELSDQSLRDMLSQVKGISDNDLLTPAAYHAFVAPILIKKNFSDYASEDIISAVFKHTTADIDMSVFDQIIYVSDYIELGREYQDCVNTRKRFFDSIALSSDIIQYREALRNACGTALKNTVCSLEKRGKSINSRTLKALECIEKTWQK